MKPCYKLWLYTNLSPCSHVPNSMCPRPQSCVHTYLVECLRLPTMSSLWYVPKDGFPHMRSRVPNGLLFFFFPKVPSPGVPGAWTGTRDSVDRPWPGPAAQWLPFRFWRLDAKSSESGIIRYRLFLQGEQPGPRLDRHLERGREAQSKLSASSTRSFHQ